MACGLCGDKRFVFVGGKLQQNGTMESNLVKKRLRAEAARREHFADLVNRLRASEDDAEASAIGHQLGRMIFRS